MDTTTIAREHIDIVLGKIVDLNPPSFEEAYRVERQYYHSWQITDAKSQLPSAKLTEAAKLKGKIASARRQQTTFFGKKHFVNLKGLKIRRPNSIVEQIVTEPADIQDGLIDYWKPIYSAKPQQRPDLSEKLLGIFSRL